MAPQQPELVHGSHPGDRFIRLRVRRTQRHWWERPAHTSKSAKYVPTMRSASAITSSGVTPSRTAQTLL
jgi:hypothetical protein